MEKLKGLITYILVAVLLLAMTAGTASATNYAINNSKFYLEISLLYYSFQMRV